MYSSLSRLFRLNSTYKLTAVILTLLTIIARSAVPGLSSTNTSVESQMASPYIIVEFPPNAPFPGDSSTPWPRGEVTLGGVPFRIPETDPSVWKSEEPFVTGPNPHTLDIMVNQQMVDRVYTLINTGGGAPGPTAYAWLEFWGDDGAYFRKDLVGGVDIRDYNYNGWTNSINGITTVNVFVHNPGVYDGERRLDMQIIDLPEAFLSQTLTHMRLSDNGGPDLQRTILEGVTIQTQITTSPPTCSSASPNLATLWPPNHQFVPINILGVTDPDGDPIAITIDSIFQDELVDAPGSGSTSPDGQGIGTPTAQVRAERVGAGNGRVYHINFTADDGQGGICSGEVVVGVPHNKKDTPVDNGPLYNSIGSSIGASSANPSSETGVAPVNEIVLAAGA